MSRAHSLSIAALLAVLAFIIALPGPILPLMPVRVDNIEPAAMSPVYGKAVPDSDGSLFVTGTDRDTALQVKNTLSIDASALSVLRYRARGFPATLELALSWRRADDPHCRPPARVCVLMIYPVSMDGRARSSSLVSLSFPYRTTCPMAVVFTPFIWTRCAWSRLRSATVLRCLAMR